jgi:hypothetical protein
MHVFARGSRNLRYLRVERTLHKLPRIAEHRHHVFRTGD